MVSMVLIQKLIQSLGIAGLDILNQCVPGWESTTAISGMNVRERTSRET
jgi:hypothetical protein